MTYFKNVNTLEELRKQYKELLKKFHPDNPNGSTKATQEINQEYERLFKLLKDRHDSKRTSDKEEKTSYYNNMKYDFSEDAKLRDVLNKVINFTGVTIEIIGEWIWISGNCILRSLADSDAFQSGRCAAHNGRPETLAIIN